MAGGFDTDGLQDFVRKGEKSPPPVFVGRENVIGDIQRAAADAWRPGPRHGQPGATRVLRGAPGAGKSSILAELEARSLTAERAEDAPRVLTVSSQRLKEDLPSVLAAVASAGRIPPKEWVSTISRLAGKLSGSIGYAGVSIGLARTAEEAPANLYGLEKAIPPEEWGAPVMVAVDEAQNLPPGPHSPPAIFLRGIHDADTGLPLTLVLAGLGDTAHRAKELGLTRGLTLHEVGPLTEGESRNLMAGFCQHFGIDESAGREQLWELAAPAEGWPRHLHFTLQALGREAIAADGDLRLADWDRAEAEAADSRLRYYHDQCSPAMADAAPLVALVMTELNKQWSRFEVKRYLKAMTEANPDIALPDGMDVNGFYDHLLHQGAIQERPDGSVHSPIPSFRTFLAGQGGELAANAILP